MQFQISPDVAERYADATAAYIRSRADVAQGPKEAELWSTLWATFRDADNATLHVPDECAWIMHFVWGNPRVWRDRHARQTVKAELHPQWRAQMLGR
mgnify:CR=1 FL=1